MLTVTDLERQGPVKFTTARKPAAMGADVPIPEALQSFEVDYYAERQKDDERYLQQEKDIQAYVDAIEAAQAYIAMKQVEDTRILLRTRIDNNDFTDIDAILGDLDKKITAAFTDHPNTEQVLAQLKDPALAFPKERARQLEMKAHERIETLKKDPDHRSKHDKKYIQAKAELAKGQVANEAAKEVQAKNGHVPEALEKHTIGVAAAVIATNAMQVINSAMATLASPFRR